MSPENKGLSARLFGDIIILFRRHPVLGDIPEVTRKHYHIKYDLYVSPNTVLLSEVYKPIAI